MKTLVPQPHLTVIGIMREDLVGAHNDCLTTGTATLRWLVAILDKHKN